MQNQIIALLNAQGIETAVTTVTKNGKEYTGISLGTGNIRPTVYYEHAVQMAADGYTVEEIAAKFAAIYNGHTTPQVDVSQFSNWNWAKPRITICIQKAGEPNLATIPFLDLDIYFRVNIDLDDDSSGSFKISKDMLTAYGVTVNELYKVAVENTKDSYSVHSMAETLGLSPEMAELIEPMLYVVTNDTKTYGAAAMTFEPILKGITDKLDDDLYIIPSSIHEVLIAPCSHMDKDDVDQMIRDVNATEVDPKERLSDHVYIYKRNDGQVTM